MVKNVFASVRRLNFVQKELMTQEIYRNVGDIYSFVSAVNQAEKLANDLIREDHILRREGSEKLYLSALEKCNQRLGKERDTLAKAMGNYAATVGIYDRIHLHETKKLIGKVQREMPDKLVSPIKLSVLVLEKVESTDAILKKVCTTQKNWEATIIKKKLDKKE